MLVYQRVAFSPWLVRIWRCWRFDRKKWNLLVERNEITLKNMPTIAMNQPLVEVYHYFYLFLLGIFLEREVVLKWISPEN